MFRKFRIVLGLVLLFFVSMDALVAKVRTTAWERPLWVVVYPINGDGSTAVAEYIASLDDGSFSAVEEFYQDQAQRFKLEITHPFELKLGPEVAERPPVAPVNERVLDTMLWSLKTRYWAWSNGRAYTGPLPDVQVFMVFHNQHERVPLDQSIGLEKGHMAVVNAYAGRAQASMSSFILAHELLHTVGATDKYDLASLMPIFPEGYADPTRTPLYPQQNVELMGGYLPLGAGRITRPPGLKQTVIGAKTAMEIGWLR